MGFYDEMLEDYEEQFNSDYEDKMLNKKMIDAINNGEE